MLSSPFLLIFYTLFFHHCVLTQPILWYPNRCKYNSFLNCVSQNCFCTCWESSAESSFVVEEIYRNLSIFKTKTSGMENLTQKQYITNHEHQQRCCSPWAPKQRAQHSHFCISVWRTKLSLCQLHHLNRLSIIQVPLQQFRVNFKQFDRSEVSKPTHLSSLYTGNEVYYMWHARAGHIVTRLSWKYYCEGVWKWKEDLRKL